MTQEHDDIKTQALDSEVPSNTTAAHPKNQQPPLFTKDFIFIAIINLTFFFGFQMTNAGIPVFVSNLGGNSILVGMVITFSTLAALAVRPVSGLILDRYGRKGILVWGAALMTLSIGAYAVFPVVGIILAIRLVHGVSWGIASSASSTIVADILPRSRFGEGMGYYTMTGSLAMALGPALSISLVQSGQVQLMIIIACSITALGLLLSFIIKPVNDAEGINVPPKAQKKAKDAHKRQSGIHFDDLFDKDAFIPALAMLLTNLGFGTVMAFIVLLGQERGVNDLALYFVIFAVTNIIVRPLVGRFIDRHGYFGAGIFASIGVAVTLVMIANAYNLIALCIAGVFGGIGIGSAMSTFQTMAVAPAPVERKGVASSTFLFGLDAGIGLGSLIGGALAQSFGYGTMFMLVAVAPLCVTALFIALGRKRIEKNFLSPRT